MSFNYAILTRRRFVAWMGALAAARFCPVLAAGSTNIEPQPYFAAVKRALEALEKLGSPISAADAAEIAALARQAGSGSVERAEKILSRYTLASLSIETDRSVHVKVGEGQRTLTEQGWSMFLVRDNPAARIETIAFLGGWGTPGKMYPAASLYSNAQKASLADTLNKGPAIERMWLLSEIYEATPALLHGIELPTTLLSGVPIEYHAIQIFSRDHGRRVADFTLATLSLSKSGNTFRNYTSMKFDFECLPSRAVKLRVLDVDGRGCMASLIIKDKLDHIYPPQAMRIAPDMTFQEQVYRADGETMRLPDGEYVIESTRGPEYLHGLQTVKIDATNDRIDVRLQRWIDPAKWGWYSGDTHIHAGGCLHYQIPTEGVSPETMIRHVRGEGLSIGDVLTWGPSWYYQKQFFTGHAESPKATLEHPELQAANNASLQPEPTPEDSESTLRYDVEVSGFPSSHAGAAPVSWTVSRLHHLRSVHRSYQQRSLPAGRRQKLRGDVFD